MNTQDTPSSRAIEGVLGHFEELPFIFLGSGMSIRYLGLPNWSGLLRHFAQLLLPGNPLALEALSSELGERPTANPPASRLPDVATLIERRFNAMWLQADDYLGARTGNAEIVRGGVSWSSWSPGALMPATWSAF